VAPEDPDLLQTMTLCALRRNDADETIRFGERTLRFDPVIALFTLSSAFAASSSETATRRSRSRRLRPGADEPAVYNGLGIALAMSGFLEEANQAYDRPS